MRMSDLQVVARGHPPQAGLRHASQHLMPMLISDLFNRIIALQPEPWITVKHGNG